MGPHTACEANRVWHCFTCFALCHVASDYTVDNDLNRHRSQPVAYVPYTHVGPDTSDFNTGCPPVGVPTRLAKITARQSSTTATQAQRWKIGLRSSVAHEYHEEVK